MYEIKNNMYQMIKVVIDKHNSVTIPAKSSIKVNINEVTEQIEDLKNSGNITYKKI
jgi:hypothetical protein